jgi:hypothetical protein
LTDIPTEQLERLLVHLREYSVDQTINRNYEIARDANLLYDEVRSQLQTRKNPESPCSDTEISFEALERKQSDHFEHQLREFDARWDLKKEQLSQKQETEIAAFEQKWREEIPNRYRKQSIKLSQLLEIEKHLGIIAEFDEAVVVRNEANALEQEEAELAQEQLVKDYSLARQKLDAGQAQEAQAFEQNREHNRAVLVAKQKVAMDFLANRALVLEVKQQQMARPRESSFDIIGQPPPEVGAVVRMGYQRRDEAQLLPRLIPPNDPRVREMKERKRNAQRERNQHFVESRNAKEWAREDVVPHAFEQMVTRVNIPGDLVESPVQSGQESDRSDTGTFNLTRADRYRS